MAGIFARIAAGEIPSHKIAEDDRFFAFLDINPVATGHTLVIPKQEVDYIFDLDDRTLADLQLFAKRVARAISDTIPCRKVGQMVLGLEVPHAHIHLVPMQTEQDMNFFRGKLTPTPDELAATAERIRSHFR